MYTLVLIPLFRLLLLSKYLLEREAECVWRSDLSQMMMEKEETTQFSHRKQAIILHGQVSPCWF